jgi:hypothetical protein
MYRAYKATSKERQSVVCRLTLFAYVLTPLATLSKRHQGKVAALYRRVGVSQLGKKVLATILDA